MPPKKSTADEKADLNNAITVDDIASVAAGSVNGFLMNVAKGVRRAHAEGGKGTRRRVELYISTEIGQPTHGGGIKTDDDKSQINAEGVKAEGGGAVSAAAAASLTSATHSVESNFADVFDGNDWSGDGDNALFDADGEDAADGDWDEYDLEIGDDADEAFDSSFTKAEEQAAAAKQEAHQVDGPNRSERPPAAAVVKPEISVGDGSSFVPPPPALTGPNTMRDPAYEQMMADHQAAAAKARQIRLAGLKRTVNKLMATVVRGKLVDRWASSSVLRETLMGKQRSLDVDQQNGVSNCDMRSRVNEAVHQLRCAVGQLFTTQRQVAMLSGLKIHPYDGLAARGRSTIEIENSSSSANAAPPAVKPTHAPLWVTADQAMGASTASTPTNNPFVKAITEFLVRISTPLGVKKNTAVDNDTSVFFFDPAPWAEVFLKESHSLPDTGVAQLIADLDAKLGEKHCNLSPESSALGEKRPRRPDDGCAGEVRDSYVTFRRPWEYVACVLALLRAAGVPARLVMAAENPPPPTDAVNVDFDDVEDEAGEANRNDYDDEPNEGGHLAVLKKLATAASGKSPAVTAESKSSSAQGAKRGNEKSTKPNTTTASAALIPTVCSHFWIEVFDPLRQSVVSVNPIPGLTTRFGAPYTFAFDSVEVKGSNGSEELKKGTQCAVDDDSSYAEVLLLDESDNEEFVRNVSQPSSKQTPLPSEPKDKLFCNERVVDVTVRYVPKYSAVYGRRIDKHCRPYRKLLWPDTFFNVKDYEEDKRYGVMDHVLVKMNAMLREEYIFDCGTRGNGRSNGEDTSRGDHETRVFSPSSRELSKLIAALDEDDATKVMMVFGSVQLEDEDSGDAAKTTPEKGVFDVQVSLNSTSDNPSPTSKSSSSLWLPFYNEREAVQLEKLLYAEPSPTTLAEAKYHPLYVLEKDLGRHEAIYPKDKTTVVGTIRGSFVYKRTAVVALRSRDGWLREGRSLMTQEEWVRTKAECQGQMAPPASAERKHETPQCSGSELVPPYRVVPPPPSRPLAPASKFYGYWQTKPFVPLPLTIKGAIPRHGNTNWYMLMGAEPPSSLVRVIEPVGASVARRINVEYRQAVTGFVKKEWAGPGAGFGSRGGWGGGFGGGYEAKIEGIVIKASDEIKFRTAMAEYVALLEEQEARRRSQRARNWWNAFAQRLLANNRMQEMFHRGNAAH